MNAYSLALFIHLLFVLVACAAASLTTFAALRLRQADNAPEATLWLSLTQRIVPALDEGSIFHVIGGQKPK